MTISYIATTVCDDKETNIIYEGLRAFNIPYFGEKAKFHGAYARNAAKVIIGGAIAYRAKDEMLLDTLWVHEDYRHKGIATRLVQEIIGEAKANAVKTIFTDTYSFQAKEFYLKQGFFVHGRVDEYLAGYSKVFLKKELL